MAIPLLAAAIPAVAGLFTSIYGAKKQSDAAEDAQRANQQAVSDQNRAIWNNYLMTRGFDPGGTAEVGQVPSGARAVNTRLPLWAVMNQPTGIQQGFVQRSSNAVAPGATRQVVRRKS